MVSCPVCKSELGDDATHCAVCGSDLDEIKGSNWIVLGTIEDKISADFGRETLTTYGIPSVIVSKSGFFGNVGLTLNPFYSKETALFVVSVPEEHKEEAEDILDMILGAKWQRKDA